MNIPRFRIWSKKDRYMMECDDEFSIGGGKLWERQEVCYGPECHMEMSDVTEEYEVMMYTGLHDKNGAEICAGDIVLAKVTTTVSEWEHDEKFVVEYRSGGFSIVNELRGYRLSDCINDVLKLSVTIVGNIHAGAWEYEGICG